MPPEPSPALRTVLVVDDSATVRLEVATMLRTAGFEVTAVSDGRAAIWQLWGSRPDLVLCDLMMPEMDGFAVLEAMRERPDWATIPYVCLTSHGERQLMRQATKDEDLTRAIAFLDRYSEPWKSESRTGSPISWRGWVTE